MRCRSLNPLDLTVRTMRTFFYINSGDKRLNLVLLCSSVIPILFMRLLISVGSSISNLWLRHSTSTLYTRRYTIEETENYNLTGPESGTRSGEDGDMRTTRVQLIYGGWGLKCSGLKRGFEVWIYRWRRWTFRLSEVFKLYRLWMRNRKAFSTRWTTERVELTTVTGVRSPRPVLGMSEDVRWRKEDVGWVFFRTTEIEVLYRS